ncbi:TDT family transporter [Streptomyces sannanensis]|uniref:TDT family transporter n=1 Tax=Streptomyces sannanensis TaxID=285536 RepID=A0ABP6S6L5_9ACTN
MVTLTESRSPSYAPSDVPRRQAVRYFGPNWYATVMGTAIVATAGTALGVPGVQAVWVLSVLLLAVVATARAGHWLHHRDQARAHLLDPAVAPFYGCLAMALLAVGAATLTAGREVIGESAAVAVDAVLFTVGTLVGLAVAVGIPYLMVVRHQVEPGSASPVWLLAVVPPMVSAATGPLLVPHLPAGQMRETLVLSCYGMFGVSLLATMVILPLVFARLVHYGPLPLAMTPTLFLVLGPLGQSVTAVSQLADVAPEGPYTAFALVYGLPVMGFALFWLVLAGAMVVRAHRRGMPFAMTWWGFTFPVGTCVTGAAGLGRHTGLVAFEWLADALFVLLVAAWAVAGVRTLRGLLSGVLLAAPQPAPQAPRPATARTR